MAVSDENESPGLRQKAEEIGLRLVRAYTYHTPVSKGKYRLYLTALRLIRHRPHSLRVRAKDGRELWANLTTGMHDSVFFLGSFEKPETDIASAFIDKGSTCLDVGANFGWYTTLFSVLAGDGGSVHSFEPVPATFRELQRNCELLDTSPNVVLNNLALGDKEGSVSVHLFEGMSTGHASLSSQARRDAANFECRMITLDSYLEEKAVEHVDFVKVDIEGAEMMFLKGAGRLFRQKVPPVFLMEMALQQTSNFGYKPNDLIEFIGNAALYDFYAVDALTGKLHPIRGFADDDIGANVFCFPRGHYEETVKKFLG